MDSPQTHLRRTGELVDLSATVIVDNHCHPIYLDDTAEDPGRWRGYFSEAFALGADPAITRTTLHYRWTLNQLAELLGCDAEEDAVIAARGALGAEERAARFLGAANIGCLLIDEGFPPQHLVRPMGGELGAPGLEVRRMQRVEQLAEALLERTRSFAEFEEHFLGELASARDRGLVALKSVVAYRCGLDVAEPERGDVRRAVTAALGAERPRIRDKALADYVVLSALQAAEAQELPVQFHTGYGDDDVDLARADPFLLRPLLQRFPRTPIVMLHGSYPYTRHAAVLAATYPNAYVDISFVVPFVHGDELRDIVRQALASAPTSRVMYSSDAFGLAEHFWLGAVRGRAAFAAVLNEHVTSGLLDSDEAQRAGEAMLRDNAVRVYGLG